MDGAFQSSKGCLPIDLSSVRTSVSNVNYTDKERICTFQQMCQVKWALPVVSLMIIKGEFIL